MTTAADDRGQIDEIVAKFFGAFDNRNGRVPTLDEIVRLFVPGAIVGRDTGTHCEHWSVAEFAEPRLRLLASGALVEFHEWETASSTEIAGHVAVRACAYRKLGTLNAQPYAGGGRKFFQLARVPSGWRIAAIAWSDDA